MQASESSISVADAALGRRVAADCTITKATTEEPSAYGALRLPSRFAARARREQGEGEGEEQNGSKCKSKSKSPRWQIYKVYACRIPKVWKIAVLVRRAYQCDARTRKNGNFALG